MRLSGALILAALLPMLTGCRMLPMRQLSPVVLDGGSNPTVGLMWDGSAFLAQSGATPVPVPNFDPSRSAVGGVPRWAKWGGSIVGIAALYVAGENWVWDGQGGRHSEPTIIVPPAFVDISDNEGEITIVIIRDGRFDGTAN